MFRQYERLTWSHRCLRLSYNLGELLHFPLQYCSWFGGSLKEQFTQMLKETMAKCVSLFSF